MALPSHAAHAPLARRSRSVRAPLGRHTSLALHAVAPLGRWTRWSGAARVPRTQPRARRSGTARNTCRREPWSEPTMRAERLRKDTRAARLPQSLVLRPGLLIIRPPSPTNFPVRPGAHRCCLQQTNHSTTQSAQQLTHPCDASGLGKTEDGSVPAGSTNPTNRITHPTRQPKRPTHYPTTQTPKHETT